jgi:hypothetical protein
MRRGQARWIALVGGLIALYTVPAIEAQTMAEKEPKRPAARPTEEYRIVPVRVHLLRDSETAAAITTLKTEDISRIFKKANRIWHAAGVHLWVESIVSEKPASTTGHEHDKTLPEEALRLLRPDTSRPEGMFHVYYIGEMRPNGIFMGRDAIFVKESARLRPVEGGIDEPLPRVTAHELGHGMGLPHRQDTFNLMASGTTGTGLNEMEIDTVRRRLEIYKWVQTPESFLKATEAQSTESNRSETLSRFRTLLELPGESPLKKRAQERLTQIK